MIYLRVFLQNTFQKGQIITSWKKKGLQKVNWSHTQIYLWIRGMIYNWITSIFSNLTSLFDSTSFYPMSQIQSYPNLDTHRLSKVLDFNPTYAYFYSTYTFVHIQARYCGNAQMYIKLLHTETKLNQTEATDKYYMQ